MCVRKQEGIAVICFTVASPLLSFAWKFYAMDKEVNSSIFLRTWHDEVKKALTRSPKLQIGEIEKEVWIPTFQHCQTLLKTLEDKSIALSEVNELSSSKRLEDDLKALSQGVRICTQTYCSYEWIPKIVNCITEYRKLCDYSAAAKFFLYLRDSLQLKGDFEDMGRIYSKV